MEIKVCDKSKWHNVDGKRNSFLEEEVLHIAYFFGWLVDHNLDQEASLDEKEIKEEFKKRKIYASKFFEYFDSVLAEDMLNEKGKLFADKYYGKKYFNDFERAFNKIYRVDDNWENYDKVSQIISAKNSKIMNKTSMFNKIMNILRKS
jgi:hypothetical protein